MAEQKVSRRELLDTIEQQNEKITKYKSRLNDVVRAYQGLVKEKEALESSLKVLEKGASNDENDEAKEETLASSLATLTAEKSKLEQNFLEDRKKLRNELGVKDKTIESMKNELKGLQDKSKLELEEAKSKLIIERHNREKETSDHALMLRELQKLIADERTLKEKLETELQTSKDSLKALQLAGTYNAEYEKRVRELELQLKAKDDKIEELAAKTKETSPELKRLREEIGQLKNYHRRDLERAEQKSLMAEERSASLSGQQEVRVANLEARLQELSDSVGSYDRLRQQDQVAMQKLKDRIAQLDLENQSLQKAHRQQNPSNQELDGDNDTNLDVQSLIERILRLRTMLRDANRRSENPMDLDELLDMNEGDKKWKKSYYQLKEEFEKFKLSRRTPSPFMTSSPSKKSASPSEEDEVDELIKLKSHVLELNEKIKYSHQQLNVTEMKVSDYQDKEAKLNATLAEIKEKFKHEMEVKEADFRLKIVQLEAEIQKQRERCLNLIEEKDEEISILKSKLNKKTNPEDSAAGDYMEDLAKMEQSKIDTLVLHYNEEMAKNQIELRELRAKKMELESALHELQMNKMAKEQKYMDEIEDMNEEMMRLKRMATKEGANLEYLKNVTLTYMLSTDGKSKEHMLKAIGAVLMFTPPEIKKVKDYNASWWPSSATSGKSRKM